MKFSLSDPSTECVLKPWGFEFELLATPSASVWCLHIRKNLATSLHCHPFKKTGYLVVSGCVEIEFLSSKLILNAGQKINFRPGLFHKTTALAENTIVFEIETPKNKQDLIRLEDNSGRTNSKYETKKESLIRILKKEVMKEYFIVNDDDRCMKVGKSLLKIMSVKKGSFIEFMESNQNLILMLIDGGLPTIENFASDQKIFLASSGDVISTANIRRLSILIDPQAEFSAIALEEDINGRK